MSAAKERGKEEADREKPVNFVLRSKYSKNLKTATRNLIYYIFSNAYAKHRQVHTEAAEECNHQLTLCPMSAP